MVFPVVMYGCERWTKKKSQNNWCFRIVVLEKTLESPLDCKEIKPVHPKGNQSWILIGRADAEAEAPILWPPNAKSQLTGKDPDDGKDLREGDNRGWDGWMASPTQRTWVWANSGRQRRTGKPGELQPMGSKKESDTTQWLNNNKLWQLGRWGSFTFSDLYVKEKKKNTIYFKAIWKNICLWS